MAKSAKTEKTETETETGKEIVPIKKGALQVDIGQRLAANIQGIDDAKDQVSELTQTQRYLRQENIALVTLGIMNAAKADDTIEPVIAINGSLTHWKQEAAKLREVFGLQNADGSLTAFGKSFLPDPDGGEDYKNSPEGKRARSRANNLSTLLKKGCEAAVALLEAEAEVSFDPDAHTLKITGGKLPRAIMGKEKTPLMLTGEKRSGAQESASFETLRNIAVRKHDPEKAAKNEAKKSGGGSPSDVEAMANAAVSDPSALSEAANVVITAMNAMEGKVSKESRKVLENLYKEVSSFLETAETV